jgi:hypothetical protein
MRDRNYFSPRLKAEQRESESDTVLLLKFQRQSLAQIESSHRVEDLQAESDILQQFQKPAGVRKHTQSAADRRSKTKIAEGVPDRAKPNVESKVEVSVPIRPIPSPGKIYQAPTARPAAYPNFSLEVPLSEDQNSSRFQAKKDLMFKELEKSTDVARERLPEVEKYFGQTGFSKAFATDNERERKIRAAPVYKRDPAKLDPVKWFQETDMDELWKKIRLNDGVDESQVGRTGLEGNKEVEFLSDDDTVSDHDDELLEEILNENFARQPHLTFVNKLNDRRLHIGFQFVSEYVIREGVRTVPASSNRGCGCAGACIPSSCVCLIKDVRIEPHNPANKTTYKKSIRSYYQSPDDPSITVLHPDYIANELKPENAHFEITECNEKCGCGPKCWNRVVGRGRTVPLEIYMTEFCGFGVRRPGSRILKGQFIDVYLGEVITQAEVEKREDAKHPDAPSYIYSLDWFEMAPVYHVDGEYFGSPMRFVNHSCSPNARSFSVQTHQGDQHVYHLAFFAIRDIEPGEQITIDYCPQEALAGESNADDSVVVAEYDVEMSGSSSTNSRGTPSVTGGADSNSRASKSSSRKSKAREQSQPKISGKPLLPANAAPNIVQEEGRSRCYCGAPNCRTWLWRAPGRQSRKRRRRNI